MVAVCFVLDLCGLSLPLLGDLKQCLLHLANFYAISSPPRNRSDLNSLRGRIGLCYIFKNRTSSSHELKIAYSPRGKFSLRDFHHAVNNLPTDAFLPEIDVSGALRPHDMKLSSILSDQVVYCWGGKDIMRKVIVLSSCLPENIDSAVKNTLMDAADKCVSVEFVLFEQSSNHLSNMPENISCFVRSLSDLDNCSLQIYLPDGRIFHSLVKRWLQDLKDDMEEPLQARFTFNNNLVGSVNHISCTLSISARPIIDGFSACQTCRCHDTLLDSEVKNEVDRLSCPITGNDLEISDVIENSLQVGETTILFMPYFQSSMKLHQVSLPIDFVVIERTNLSTLSEGVLIGPSYFVAPSAGQDVENSSDEMDQSELNTQCFQGICNALYSLDQGLICSSYCNMETMREAFFNCYYVLQPSNNGPMLLRRIAGSEEVLPMPGVNHFADSTVSRDIQNSIQASLLKIELRDYNPLLHERGFHQKLNSLIRESLQFGSIPPELDQTTSQPISNQPVSPELISKSNKAADSILEEEVVLRVDLDAAREDKTTASTAEGQEQLVVNEVPKVNLDSIVTEGNSQLDLVVSEDKTTASIAEEWEQLVVNEIPNTNSPTCITKPKMDHLALSLTDSNKQLDVKTSRILERLEVPRKLKAKAASPIATGKKPLIPFQSTQGTDQSFTSSQLMKPNFQRLKRKHR